MKDNESPRERVLAIVQEMEPDDRKALIDEIAKLDNVDGDGQVEYALVWKPDVLVGNDGKFYRYRDGQGLMCADDEIQLTENGKPHLVVGSRIVWLGAEVYKAFVGPYKSRESTILYLDGDSSNCRPENLFLVKDQTNSCDWRNAGPSMN